METIKEEELRKTRREHHEKRKSRQSAKRQL